MTKVIGIWNRKGGVGSTMLTGHFCFIAAELGLSVAGASVGGPGDLRHWLRPAKIPCFDSRREKLPADVDLVVLDVYSQSNYQEVLRPDIWLIPVDSQEADRRAVALASTLAGNVRRIRNFRHLGCEVSLELESTDAVIPPVPGGHGWLVPGGLGDAARCALRGRPRRPRARRRGVLSHRPPPPAVRPAGEPRAGAAGVGDRRDEAPRVVLRRPRRREVGRGPRAVVVDGRVGAQARK